MTQYIDKSALVAEIERRKNQFVSQAESFRKIGKEDKESYYAALASNMNSLSCFLDALEVKEVDLEKEINTWFDYGFPNDDELLDYIKETAKHFFELGLKANTLEVKEIDIADMADDYYEALMQEADWMDVDTMGHCRLAYYTGCKDVLNKIQKGE